MADKRISQLVDRGTVVNNDVIPIVVSGAVTTNKATISSIQTFMQGNLDVGVTSVGITFGTSGTDINASGSPVTSSGNITINLPTASAVNRGALSSADWTTFNAKQQSITLTTTGTSGAATLVSGALNIPNYSTDLSGYVTLGTTQTITAQKTFTTSGGSDSVIITTTGAGFALDAIKAGNGEVIRVNKTSGTGNAMTVIGGNFEAPAIVKTGGTSSQFLKADGSVDSNAYTTNTGTVTSVGLSSATSGVTIGSTPITTSGTITLAIATASGSQNGLLSSTDWTTFNNKQNALTNPVTGTGVAGQVAYWTGTNSQAGSNNLFWDNAAVKLGIGTNTPEGTGLTVAGGGVLVSLDSGAARKVLELYASSTGAKVSSTYVGASSYGSLELLTSNEARLTITAAGDSTFSGALSGTSASFSSAISINSSAVANYDLNIYNTIPRIQLQNPTSGTTTSDGLHIYQSGSDSYILNKEEANLYLGSNNGINLTIASTGAATFSSSVQAASLDVIGTSGTEQFRIGNTTGGTDFGITVTENATTIINSAEGATGRGIQFQSGGANTMIINSSGNVGIGTASPFSTAKLQIKTATDVNLAFQTSTLDATGIQLNAFNDAATVNIPIALNGSVLYFTTSTTERMRITSVGNTQPGADNAYSLGVSGTRWSAVWAANGTIQTSDEREKKDIIDSDLGLDFVNQLRPVSFKWKVGQNLVTSEVVKDEEGNPILDEEGNEKTEPVIIPREGKRTHYGLIAQEVQELLDGKDFGGFIHDEETDTKGLRYDQFVPLLIKSIQELSQKIVILESKLK